MRRSWLSVCEGAKGCSKKVFPDKRGHNSYSPFSSYLEPGYIISVANGHLAMQVSSMRAIAIR